jgi:ATP-dependent exoDNAse (exonuclease V) alpha subunit
MQVYLTRNRRKDVDFINGMRCTVEAFDSSIPAVHVLTATGHRLAITKSPDDKLGNMKYFPMRYGYASTIMKFAGATLDRVCVWLDRPYVPGAAYTAMSRVRMQEHCLIGGHVRPEHFTPAR